MEMQRRKEFQNLNQQKNKGNKQVGHTGVLVWLSMERILLRSYNRFLYIHILYHVNYSDLYAKCFNVMNLINSFSATVFNELVKV